MIHRANPLGYTPGSKPRSAELSQIDANTSHMLDKRTGQSDTLASDVLITGALELDSYGNPGLALVDGRPRTVTHPCWNRALRQSSDFNSTTGKYRYEQASQGLAAFSFSPPVGIIRTYTAGGEFRLSLPVFDWAVLYSVALGYIISGPHCPELAGGSNIGAKVIRLGGSHYGESSTVYDAATTAAEYYAAGALKWLTVPQSALHSIAPLVEATDMLQLHVFDEQGSGAVANNQFAWVRAIYTITNIRW